LIDLEACEVRYWTERIGERERRIKGRKRSETHDITASTSDTLSPTGLKKKMYDNNEQPTTVLSDGEDEFGWNSNNYPTNDYEKVPEEGGGGSGGGISSSHLPTNRQTSHSSTTLSMSSLSPQTSPKKEQQMSGNNLAQDDFPSSELTPRKKEKHRRSMSCDMDLPDSPAKGVGAAIGGAGDFESTVSSIKLSPSTQAANAKKRVDALDLHNTKHFRRSSNVELSKPGSGYSTPTSTSSATAPNLPASLIIAGVLYTAEADEEGKHSKGSKVHEKKHKKTKRREKERTEADTPPGTATSSSSEALATPHLQAQLPRPFNSLPSTFSSPNDTSLVTLSTSTLIFTPTSSTPISISTSPSSLQPSNSNSNTTPPPVSVAVTTISGFAAPTAGTPLVSLISSPRTTRGEDHDRWFSDEDDVFLPDDAEGKGKHKRSKEKKTAVGVSISSTKDYSNETKEQERIRRESEKKEKELQKSIEKERKKKEKEEKKEEKLKKKQEKKEAKTLIKEKEIEDPKEVERLRKEQDRKEKEVQRASEKERKRKEKEEKREQERQKKLIKRRRSAGAGLNSSVSGDSSGLPLSFSSSDLILGENGLGTSEEISTVTMERHLKSELQDYLSGGEATDSDNESDKETGGKDEESTQQQETNHNNASNTINNPNPNASRFAFELFSTSHRSIFVQIPSFSGKKDPKQKPFLDTTADSLVIRTATGEDLEWWMDVVRECCACRFIHELPTQLPHYINTLVSQQELESCNWFNVLMTRYFKEMQHSPAFANKVKQIISKLFNKMNPKRPKFLVSLNTFPPFFLLCLLFQPFLLTLFVSPYVGSNRCCQGHDWSFFP
jgi:hypothetical protein